MSSDQASQALLAGHHALEAFLGVWHGLLDCSRRSSVAPLKEEGPRAQVAGAAKLWNGLEGVDIWKTTQGVLKGVACMRLSLGAAWLARFPPATILE